MTSIITLIALAVSSVRVKLVAPHSPACTAARDRRARAVGEAFLGAQAEVQARIEAAAEDLIADREREPVRVVARDAEPDHAELRLHGLRLVDDHHPSLRLRYGR